MTASLRTVYTVQQLSKTGETNWQCHGELQVCATVVHVTLTL